MTTADLIKGPRIQLYGGGYFDFANPESTPLTIEQIAQGLGNECRYSGQCEFYSVAEHSVLASYIVEPRFAYDTLMHDSPEAVIGDMVKPLKVDLPDYQVVEARVEPPVFRTFGVTYPLPKEVKVADLQMLLLEKEELLGNTDAWSWVEGVEKPEGIHIQCWLPNEARDQFLRRYYELREQGFGL